MLNEILLENIELYHQNGWVLTPLNDKRPFVNGWQNAKWSEKLNITPFENVKSAGWVIDKKFVVIDVDNHKDKSGTESLKKMSEHYGFDFLRNAAVKVCTANGGYHLYYKLPPRTESAPEFTIPNKLPQFQSIEFKHTGRQVVIPGSVLDNGKSYRFHPLSSKDFTEIKLLPEALSADLIKNSPARQVSKLTAKAAAADKAALDAPVDIERFTEWLDRYQLIGEGDRNNEFYKLACEAKDLGLSRKITLGLLVGFNQQKVHPRLEQGEVKHCVNSAFRYSKNEAPVRSLAAAFANDAEIPAEEKILTEDEAKKQFTEVIAWQDSLVRGAKGEVSRTKFATKNTEIFLDNLPNFRSKLAVNLFSMDTIWRRPATWHKATILTGEVDRVLDDDDLIRIREALNAEGYDPAPSHILEAARAVSLRNEYHPVKEYLDGLPKWDGQERLKHFFPVFCGAEGGAYSEQIGVKLFVAIVARIYTPGCKFDYLPIIIGDQGIGKSTMLEAIAIKPQWYTDNLGAIDNKDVILRMRSKLIVENAELTMFDKSDPNTVKAFLSRRVDRDRLPYDRLPRDLPRQCVIVATTNKDRFLQDETGNRRMWPIEVTKIDLPNIKKCLPLLYAEAIARFKAGEQLYLDNEEASKAALQHQSDRYNTDDWEEEVMRHLDTEGCDRTTIAKIWNDCFHLGMNSLGFREQKRIGSILRRLGWKRKTIEIDGKTVSGFKK